MVHYTHTQKKIRAGSTCPKGSTWELFPPSDSVQHGKCCLPSSILDHITCLMTILISTIAAIHQACYTIVIVKKIKEENTKQIKLFISPFLSSYIKLLPAYLTPFALLPSPATQLHLYISNLYQPLLFPEMKSQKQNRYELHICL